MGPHPRVMSGLVTVRVPKWLVGGGVLLLIAGLFALAFSLGRSSGGDKSSTAAEAHQGPTAREAVCSKSEAEAATLDSEFDDKIRAGSLVRANLEGTQPTEVPFFTDNQLDFQVAVLECADLTGDSVGEMLVGLSAGASGRVFQWAIFTPDSRGRWRLAFARELVGASSLEITGDSVVASTPTYGLEDPLCCPSGHKTTRVVFRDGEFRVVSNSAAPPERLISIEAGQITRIGLLAPFETTPSQAIAAFGTPTSIVNHPSSSCHYHWDDIGLAIVFANFGGGNPCGEDGRIGSFELTGSAAEQAGWHTAEGARVGTTATALERLYPGAERSGTEMTLVETPSPYGSDGTIAIAEALLVDGEARGYRFYVGGAGE